MRKLFSFNMVTLDGFFAGPDGNIDWHHVDEEFNDFAMDQMSNVDLLLFGRVTYELMASYWPTTAAIQSDPVIAGKMNELPKGVLSKTLGKVDWNNSRLIRDNIVEEVTRLKQQAGKDIALFGSANAQSSLMELDLIDEYRIMVNPVVLGSGIPLFKGRHGRLDLKLVGTRIFHSGNVLLSYQPTARFSSPA
jgi:dihydrofolate reductase